MNSSSLILCRSPMVDSSVRGSKVTTEFLLDNLRFDFSRVNSQTFGYEPNPVLRPLNQQDPLKAYRYNPGSFIQLEVRVQAVIGSRAFTRAADLVFRVALLLSVLKSQRRPFGFLQSS